MTLGRVHNVVYRAHGHCDDEGIKCFLFDSEGYLVLHPIMFDPTYIGPVERQHLNHKEPLVGKDILDQGKMVSKRFCNSLVGHTITREDNII